ncbi:MAG: hypothetical protein VYE22_29805 [Myxococcota bacterium]|nr:hypothetical protein [Myxococcota bacterium]
MTRSAAWLLVAALCAGGCASTITTQPQLVASSGGVDPDTYFAHLVWTLRLRGYEIALLQPEQRRVGVCAHFQDPETAQRGAHRVAVICSPIGRCHIVPLGPKVEREPTRYHLPRPFADELQAMRRSMDLPLSPGGPPPVGERVAHRPCQAH